MKKRILSILLVACMLVTMMPTMGLMAAEESSEVSSSSLPEAVDGVITLEENATYEISSAWTVPAGVTKLDLNGATIEIGDANLGGWDNGLIVVNGGELEITGGSIVTSGDDYGLSISGGAVVTITNADMTSSLATVKVFGGSTLNLGTGAKINATKGDSVRAYGENTVVNVNGGAMVTSGTGTNSAGDNAICVYAGATLNLTDGTAKSIDTDFAGSGVVAFNGGTVNIGENGKALSVKGNGAVVAGGKLVSSGTIEGNNSGLYVQADSANTDAAGYIEINGGSVTSTYATPSNSAAVWFSSTATQNNVIVINDGDINGYPFNSRAYNNNSNITVNGGTFDQPLNASLLADGTYVLANADGTVSYSAEDNGGGQVNVNNKPEIVAAGFNTFGGDAAEVIVKYIQPQNSTPVSLETQLSYVKDAKDLLWFVFDERTSGNQTYYWRATLNGESIFPVHEKYFGELRAEQFLASSGYGAMYFPLWDVAPGGVTQNGTYEIEVFTILTDGVDQVENLISTATVTVDGPACDLEVVASGYEAKGADAAEKIVKVIPPKNGVEVTLEDLNADLANAKDIVYMVFEERTGYGHYFIALEDEEGNNVFESYGTIPDKGWVNGYAEIAANANVGSQYFPLWDAMPGGEVPDGTYTFKIYANSVADHNLVESVRVVVDNVPNPVNPTPPTYAPVVPTIANYGITVVAPEKGTLSVDKTVAAKGAAVTVTAAADYDYALTLSVKDAAGNAVAVTDNGDGTYTFTMPASTVTVSATLDKNCPSDNYTDLDTSLWYHEAIDFVITKGIMTGDKDTFMPDGILNRAMMVQILYNMAGNPAVTGESIFTDVAEGDWYYDAVVWGTENGLVGGVGNDQFAPLSPLTREQMATFLYRYAAKQGIDMKVKGDLGQFTDGSDVSSWSKVSMEWAVGNGIFTGNGDGTVTPLNAAKRSEIAQTMMNYFVNVAK